MAVMTREVLVMALEKTYGRKGMAHGDVEDLCDFVLSFFGYDDYVLDNTLSAPERDIFYNLEEFGFLEPHREEVNIFRGKTWRVNQWVYKKDNIYKAANAPIVEEEPVNIYDEIFKEM